MPAPLRRPRRITLGSLAALAASAPIFRPGTAAAATSACAPTDWPEPRRLRIAARRLRRSLRASTGEGVFAEVINACAGSTVLTGWALHLGGGPFAVSVLGALPFLAQLVHLPAAWITSSLGRRRVALFAVALSRQAWLPLVALPFLPLSSRAQLAVLLAVAGASSLLAVIGNNAWVAWMGDLVPRAVRGRYFARRTVWCTVGGTGASLLSGVALDAAGARGHEGAALALLALVACLAGAATTWLMSLQHEPAEGAAREPLRPGAALRPFVDPKARAVLAYQIVWSAAIGLSSSLFAVHMLQNLKMGFALIALQGASVALVRVLVVPLWGRAVDRLGAQPVVVACSLGIAVVPIIWLFPTPDNLWPIAFDALASGVLWSGQALAVFALPLAVAPREGRPFYLAAFSAVAGVAFAAASALGGAVAELLPREALVLGHPMFGLQAMFVVSALLRFAAGLVAMRISEPGAQPVGELVRSAAARAGQLGQRLAHPLPIGKRE